MRQNIKDKKFIYKTSIFLIVLVSILSVWSFYRDYKTEIEIAEKTKLSNIIKNIVTTKINASKTGLTVFEFLGNKHKLSLTINSKLDNFIKKELRRYKTDHSAVVVINNNTGDIISIVGMSRKDGENNKIALSSSHPAASLSKIVTAASLLENSNLKIESKFKYHGRGTTLYKYQLFKKPKRWFRKISLGRAFAFSNNVVFGKAAIENIKKKDLFKTANLFGFNQKITNDFNLTSSTFTLPSDEYNLAEMASGFNRKTLISPVHAAFLSSVIANDGVLLEPKIINSVINLTDNSEFAFKERGSKRVISKNTAKHLREMMRMAVSKGTARKTFRTLNRKLRKNLEIGGKTGSISGGIPYGKRDWFVSFARPKNDKDDKGISIAVMNINVKKWHVRSAYIAKRVIEYFFKKQPLLSLN